MHDMATILDGIVRVVADIRPRLSCIFPESSGRTVTVIADAVANTWTAWAEIVDSAATSFSTINATKAIQILGVAIESITPLSVKDMFHGEIAYGDNKIPVDCGRWVLGSADRAGSISIFPRNTPIIPAGETIYARVMCEEALGQAEVSFLYAFAY
jgi:hypothetical protein